MNHATWLNTIQLDSKRFKKAKTTQPEFVIIIWPDIEECMLSRFCMCMLMRFGRSLMSQLKGRAYGEG